MFVSIIADYRGRNIVPAGLWSMFQIKKAGIAAGLLNS
jgi:hypothetical protein